MEFPFPIVIRGDRGQELRRFAMGAAMTAASVFTASTADGIVKWIGIAGVVLFGAATLVLSISIVKPPRLTLTESGIACEALRSWHMPWSDVAGIRLNVTERSPVVLIDYRAEARRTTRFGRRVQVQAVPERLMRSPEEIAKLIEDGWSAVRANRPDLGDGTTAPPIETVARVRWVFPWSARDWPSS